MSEKKNKLSRRNALKLFGKTSVGAVVAPHPLKLLFSAFVGSPMSGALADETYNSRRYLFICMHGAPARWVWDPLHPFDPASEIIPNNHVGSKYVSTDGQVYDDLEYESTNINGINMPWMWQFDVPKFNGANNPLQRRPMSELMDSMLMIRGIETGNPAHTGAQHLQNYPLGIPYSIGSLASDHSSLPIPFVNMNGLTNGFKSKKGLSQVNLNAKNTQTPTDNLLEKLLKPFMTNPSPGFLNNKSLLDAAISEVMGELNLVANQHQPKSQEIINSQQNAEELIKQGFSDLATKYPELVSKYRRLIETASNADPNVMTLPGINDLPVIPNGTSDDLRDMFTDRDIFRMAKQFAVAEYIMTNDICPSMTISPGPFQGFNFDEHQRDKLLSLMFNTYWNRALAACLLELIDQLKAKDLYNETVINIGGEFGRNPRNDGTGSDHSSAATSYTFLSGALVGNQIIGNTIKNAPITQSIGTWGYKGKNGALITNPNREIGYLNLGHLTSSIATMLRVPSPVTASQSLVTENEAGQLSALLPGAKLVDE